MCKNVSSRCQQQHWKILVLICSSSLHGFLGLFPRFKVHNNTQRFKRSAEMDFLGDRYREQFRQSISNPTEYWAKVAENTVWTKKFNKVVENPESPFARWFPGGRLSMCYNAVDRHVDEGRGHQVLLHWSHVVSYGPLWSQLSPTLSHRAPHRPQSCGTARSPTTRRKSPTPSCRRGYGGNLAPNSSTFNR